MITQTGSFAAATFSFWATAEAVNKAGHARRVGLLMEYQKGKVVLQKTTPWVVRPKRKLCGNGF